jgi:predicted HTH transcriptional regulator
MSPTELRKLLSGGESERVEFKRSTGQRTEAAKTVCAMLNGLGGFVVFGVTNSGEPIGQQIGVKTLEDVASELRRIEPPAFPDVETISLKRGNAAVLLTVQAVVDLTPSTVEPISGMAHLPASCPGPSMSADLSTGSMQPGVGKTNPWRME